MKKMVDNAATRTLDLSMQQHKYNTAKEEYEQARLIYREMKIKQQEARSLLKRPHQPVIIKDWSHQ